MNIRCQPVFNQAGQNRPANGGEEEDQGDADQFLAGQLQPAVLAEAARQKDWPLTLRIQPGYDHSYYFMASFIEDHLRFHAAHLFK